MTLSDRVTRVETFARAGFLARGVVYMLLGYIALSTSDAEGPTGVLEAIREMPGGPILLALTGIGLAGYGIFRLYGAAIDIDGEGTGLKGAGKRIGHGASGLAHLLLAYLAISQALGAGGGSGGGDSKAQAAGWLMSLPFGEALLAALGIAFLLAALNQTVKAWTAKFMDKLDADAPHAAEYIGRAGYAARAIVFLVIGWKVASASLSGNASEVAGIGEVLTALREPQWLYMVVAFGLLLFGVYSLVMARYRRIRDDNVLARLKASIA